jgi:uncharacterized protein
MSSLYPSWIEIPVSDLDRALRFYRAVFGLTDTPIYHDFPPQVIAVLLASEKSARAPGVSLVKSPTHTPGSGGAQVNFHVDTHAALQTAIATITAHGGMLNGEIVDMGDGTRYITARDSEGNIIALSSYESLDDA